MEANLVSILLPVYNGQDYIVDMLDSIFKQSYRPIEVIIGDDCSKDKSKDLILEWKEEVGQDNFIIKYVENKENIGLTGNIAKLSTYVNGEFVFLADQDDVWDKSKVSEQVEYLKQNSNCIICLCDRRITNNKLEVIIPSEYEAAGYHINSMGFHEVIKHLYCYASNCMAIKNNGNIKDILSIPNGIIMHDLYISVIASQFGTIDYLYKPLVNYRIHGHNLSGNYSAQFSKNGFDSFMKTMRKSKRIKQSQKNDGLIIIEDLKKKYNNDITMSESPLLFQQVIKNRLIWSLKQTYRDYKEGIIGLWRKYLN